MRAITSGIEIGKQAGMNMESWSRQRVRYVRMDVGVVKTIKAQRRRKYPLIEGKRSAPARQRVDYWRN